VKEGDGVTAGQTVATLKPDEASVRASLRALAYVGAKDDLPPGGAIRVLVEHRNPGRRSSCRQINPLARFVVSIEIRVIFPETLRTKAQSPKSVFLQKLLAPCKNLY